jgi:hypothetical protein
MMPKKVGGHGRTWADKWADMSGQIDKTIWADTTPYRKYIFPKGFVRPNLSDHATVSND